ncbi:ATP-binding protein [uncultured Helicobacter sp.]|uniref:ATP-binding protein n=1 Tax=uncultured Helicobacter sp. TaxID=175537 RepID=UPI002629BE5C|nr:ATP-binding protein [uncultured Helicobacter sp.]
MQELSKTYLDDVAGILPRRYGLKVGKSFLYGAPSVGKSAIALLHSKAYKKCLYINCVDCRTDIESANKLILKSYLERTIELLIVDNYTPHISLPNLPHIILIASSPAHCPEGFVPKHIRALSFEEYVSFDNKNFSIQHLFNSFLKDGNLVQILSLSPSHKIPRKQEILKLALQNDFHLFSALLHFQAQKLSIHHIYTILKKTHKISKDRIYPLLHSLEERGMIYLVPHSKQKHKKLYFYDFTLPLCVSNHKHLQAILENMLLLEILNFCERYGVSEAVSYGDMGEFICDLGVFIFLPFATRESIESKLAHFRTSYPRIYVITFDFEGRGRVSLRGLESMQWEAMSFINFALEFSV